MNTLGQDPYEGNPYQLLGIINIFAIITAEIDRLKLLTAMVQDGGYNSSELGGNINSFIDGFENNFHKYDFQVVCKFS